MAGQPQLGDMPSAQWLPIDTLGGRDLSCGWVWQNTHKTTRQGEPVRNDANLDWLLKEQTLI